MYKAFLKKQKVNLRPALCTSQLQGLPSIEFENRKCVAVLTQEFLLPSFAKKLLSRFQQPS